MNATVGTNNDSDEITLSSGTSKLTITLCNSTSIVACTLVLSVYLFLVSQHAYRRLMKRNSLVIAACMAFSDLILHVSRFFSNRFALTIQRSALIWLATGTFLLASSVHSLVVGFLRLLPYSQYSTPALLRSTPNLYLYLEEGRQLVLLNTI